MLLFFLKTAVIFSVFLLMACSREEVAVGPKYTNAPIISDVKKHYVFAIHPLHNPQLLQKKFEPLMVFLGQQIPNTAFDLETSNDYADYEGKLRDHKPDFSLPNPYHAVMSQDWDYHIIAKMGDDSLFRGIFIVRKDSKIRDVKDLRGKIVAYPAPTALAAAMMPQLYLQKHGINVQTELNNKYVGTHNSSIMNAYLHQSAASATWPVAWRAFQQSNPKEANDLKVIWETPTLIQNAIIVRNDVPPDVAHQVARLLTTLQDTEQGRLILRGIETPSFVTASNEDFEVVRMFLKEFNTLVNKQK